MTDEELLKMADDVLQKAHTGEVFWALESIAASLLVIARNSDPLRRRLLEEETAARNTAPNSSEAKS